MDRDASSSKFRKSIALNLVKLSTVCWHCMLSWRYKFNWQQARDRLPGVGVVVDRMRRKSAFSALLQSRAGEAVGSRRKRSDNIELRAVIRVHLKEGGDDL